MKLHIDKVKTRLWLMAAQALIPFVKFIGKIHAPYSVKSAIEDFYPMCRTLKPLDIILSNTRGHLSNVLNPGPWKHAIVYIGKEDGIPMIIEAIGKGVIKRPLVECLSEKDEVAVMRYRGEATSKEIEKGVKWVNKQVGKDYDYQFDLFSDHKYENFYCSELAFYTHKNTYKHYRMEPRESFGVPTITPSDFFNASGKYKMVMRTRPES